ncbi:MAG: hypothetical protein OHK0057_28280 [Thermoflexibacter sp.]
MLTKIKEKTYTEADFAKFIEKITEQKVEFADGQFIPVHGTQPLPADLVDYILSDDFDEKELTFPFPMATEKHDDITSTLHVIFGIFARQNKSLKIYSQGTLVYIPLNGKTRIPDVIVVDKSNNRRDELHRVLTPVVVVEVLSKSTQSKDKNEKLDDYQSIDSLQSYILISQDQPLVVAYSRLSENLWQQEILKGLDKLLSIQSISFQVSLKEIYEGVEFSESE